MRRYILRFNLAALLLLSAASLPAPGRGAERQFPPDERRVVRVAEGVEHIEIRRGIFSETSAADRWVIEILELDPQKTRIELGLALDQIVGSETTSSMAARLGALAAVNGGYFRTSGLLRGEPRGIIARKGRLLSEPELRRSGLAVLNGPARIQMAMARFDFRAAAVSGRNRRDINGINRPIEGEEVILYTPEFHRTTLGARDVCELVIERNRIARFERAGGGQLPDAGYILGGRGSACDWLGARRRGTAIGLQTEVIAEPPLAFAPDFVIGGGPRLLSGGEFVSESEGFNQAFTRARHPRTAVGVRKDGRILLVVVDGRQPKHSVGMTIRELAGLMSELGCVEALNLDGGGSSTMVIRNQVVNKPSDSTGERAVSDALLVYTR